MNVYARLVGEGYDPVAGSRILHAKFGGSRTALPAADRGRTARRQRLRNAVANTAASAPGPR